MRPLGKRIHSNTPSGPFQMIVPASLIKSVSAWEVAGPRQDHLVGPHIVGAPQRGFGLRRDFSPTTTSIGNGSVAPCPPVS